MLKKSIIQLTKNSNLNFVIVRPALIYGDSVKGNLLRLLNIINTRIPLPLANIRMNVHLHLYTIY